MIRWLAILLVASLVACAATTAALVPRPVPVLGSDALGVVVGLVNDDDRALFREIAETNVGHVRLDWYYQEPGSFGRFARNVRAARAEGLRVYAGLSMPSRHPSEQRPAPDAEEWATAWNLALRELGHEVDGWSIWNEANTEPFWPWGMEHFVVLYEIAHALIREHDGTVAGVELAGNEAGALDWYARVLDRVPGPDVHTVHRYGDPSDVEAFVRLVLDMGDRPVWLTETGLDWPDMARSDMRDRQRDQLAGVLAKQRETRDWQRTYPFHWHAPDERAIRGHPAQDVLRAAGNG